MAIINEFLKTR